jgi:hypothetical protein
MQPDPFGNLQDWGRAMELLSTLSENGTLNECQPGLARILAFQGNWRIREETLKRLRYIENPSNELIRQVINIVADANLYYEMRIIACQAIEELLNRNHHPYYASMQTILLQTLAAQMSVPQPPIFQQALESLHSLACAKFCVASNQ